MQKHVWPARLRVSGAIVLVISSLVVFTGLLPSPGAFAQSEDDDLTILITGSRFAETADETLVPVTVITRKDIERKQAATVEEVLRSVPGVTLSNNGGAGQLTTLFLRGTNSNHVLVLIDGVKVGAGSSGLTQFEHLPLDQIEKIEVVRGPRSSLYGSEAIGGVVQIFTRKGGGKTRPRLVLGGGSHNTRTAEVGVSGGGENAWYNLGASTESTDGFDVCLASFCINERDADGFDNDSFSVRGGAALTDSFFVEGSHLNSDNDTEFDGGNFGSNRSEHLIRASSVKATLQASEKWQSSLLFGWSEDDLESFGGSPGRFITKRDQVDWQNTIRMGKNDTVIAGVDYLEDETDSDGFSTYDVERDNTGVFALWRTQAGGNDWEFSLRNDDNDQFGNHATGSVGWGRNLGGGNRITAAYGTAFKSPTFGQLYGFGGTPELDPEISQSIDLGLFRRDGDTEWAVNFYRTKIDDLIVYIDRTPNNMMADGKNENLEQAEITGVELSGTTHLGGWDVSGTLTWQDAEESQGDNKGGELLKRPARKLDLDFNRRFGHHLFGVNIYAQSRSKDFGFVDIPGFAVVNLRGEMRLEKNWAFGLKFNNVLDKEYETADGYPQDRRNVMLTLRYLPDRS